METTERDRIELYELAKEAIGSRFAELFMSQLPPRPHHLATTQDLAVTTAELRTEMADLRAELRTELAGLRAEMADLRTDLRTEMADLRTDLRTEMADLRIHVGIELHDAITTQTRTMMLGLVGSVTGLAITQILVGVLA